LFLVICSGLTCLKSAAISAVAASCKDCQKLVSAEFASEKSAAHGDNAFMPSADNASNAFPTSGAGRQPKKLRNIAVAVICGAVGVLIASVALVALSNREPLPAITMADVDAAAARWTANGPTDYDLDLEQTGVNPGQIHVEVRHGQVTAMTLNGHPTRQHLWDDWSVPGIFAIIRRDVEVCMPDLNAKAQRQAAADSQNPTGSVPPVLPRGLFDPHDGHPTQYHRITPTGADANWRVTKFVRQ
jgi:hypothetical protein